MSDYTVELILDEIIKIRQLLETAQPSLYVSLSPSQVQVEELTKRIQSELLRQSQENRGTHS